MTALPRTDALLPKIAHDLRGPLMPLRTAAWLLRSELGEQPRAGELAQIIDRQSVRLAQLMEELADWARCMGGRDALEPAPLEPMLALDMAIGAIPGCLVEPRLGAGVETTRLVADGKAFNLMLRALIEHAMQRDSGGAPEVDLWLEAGQLRIRVRDHGPPLDAAARATLFSAPQARPFDDGLGLRLLMARSIAEAHGGGIGPDPGDTAGLSVTCFVPVEGR